MGKRKKLTSKQSKDKELPIFNTEGKEVGSIKLDKDVFDGKISPSLIHQAVVTYLANKRKGLASTKTRGEVSGGGIKPWRQKGTGRARVGSIRSPLWRGGGITFGPKPHSYHKDFPKKMKILAFKSALNAKANDQEILILKDLSLDTHKTKNFYKIIGNLKLDNQKIRVVLENIENNVRLATRNLSDVLLIKAQDVNAMEVVDCKKLVLTEGALHTVENRVKKCLK